MATILFTLALLLFFFVGLGIRLLLVKGGEFRGTCASQSPFLNADGESCSYCGKKPSECENKQTIKS